MCSNVFQMNQTNDSHFDVRHVFSNILQEVLAIILFHRKLLLKVEVCIFVVGCILNIGRELEKKTTCPWGVAKLFSEGF